MESDPVLTKEQLIRFMEKVADHRVEPLGYFPPSRRYEFCRAYDRAHQILHPKQQKPQEPHE